MPVVLLPYWRAFHTLHRDRPRVGMDAAPLPIPSHRIRQYARDHGYAATPREYEWWLAVLRPLDDAWLAEHEARQRAATPPVAPRAPAQ